MARLQIIESVPHVTVEHRRSGGRTAVHLADHPPAPPFIQPLGVQRGRLYRERCTLLGSARQKHIVQSLTDPVTALLSHYRVIEQQERSDRPLAGRLRIDVATQPGPALRVRW